ncbi:MAG: hypothetical protein ACI85S_001027, partial [Pseudohongiellaceae bacterium]
EVVQVEVEAAASGGLTVTANTLFYLLRPYSFFHPAGDKSVPPSVFRTDR